MNGNMKFGNPVDGKKRKKYKSKLWSDIVDEYEEDMRKEKILQDKLLEKEMINKKEIVKKSLVDLNIPIDTQTKESIPSVVKNNPECKTKQCENPVQPPKKSEKTLSELWSEIVDEYEERIKSIPTHENSVEKDSSTSVDKCIKTDETVIRSKTSAPKMKINVEAPRINPPETEKLSVEPTTINKTKKESKITKENQTEREYVISSDKGEKSAKKPTILKTLEKNTPEQSSAIVDLRVSDANNAIKQNKCKEKNLQKDTTNTSQKSENISLKSTELCKNASALDSTTIQTSIPEMKTGVEGLKTNPHLKKDDKKETSKHEIDNKKLLVDSKKTEKNKKESIITQVSIERKKKSGVSNEQILKSIPTHENSVEKDSSTSVDKCIKTDETVIRSKTSAPKMKINVEAPRINPPETEKLSVEPTAINKTKKESKITIENQTEREYVTSSDKGEKSAKKPTILKTLEKNTSEQSSAIVDLRVSDANNAIKQNKCKEKNLQKDTTNTSQKSENISLKSTELCKNASALDSTTIQTSIPEMKTGVEGLKTNPHLKKDDKKETSKHEIDNKKLLVDSKKTEKNKKESIITQVSVERKKKSGVSNEQICKDMKSQKLEESIVTHSSTYELETEKPEETINRSKTSTSITYPRDEAVSIVPSVNLDSMRQVPKHKKSAEKPKVELSMPIGPQKIISINSKENSLKKHSSNTDAELKNAGKMVNVLKELGKSTSTQSSDIYNNSSKKAAVAKNAKNDNKNQEFDDKIDRNSKIRKSGGMTAVLESPVIQVDAKEFPKNKRRAKTSILESIINIVKPDKESIITHSSTSELQTEKPEETIIRSKTSTSITYPRDEAVSIVPSVNLDIMREVPKHEKSAEKPRVELSMPIGPQKIMSINSKENSLKKHSSITDAELKNAGKMVNVLKELGKSTSTQSSDIYNNSSEKAAVAKNATNDNKNLEFDDKIDRNSKIRKSGGMTAVLESPVTLLSTSTMGTCAENMQKVPSVIQVDAKEFTKNKRRAKTSILESIIHIVKPEKESIFTQSTVVINSPINLLSTSTTRTNDEAVQVLPPVIQDDTKDDPRNEIFKTTTSYETLFEKVSPTSADMPNNSVKTVKKMKSTFKKNKITINDNEKDTNTMTQMSAKEHNEHKKLYDKSDIRNYFSIQTPPSRKQNFVDELCNNLCDKPVESSLAVHAHKENKTSVNDNKTNTNMQSQKAGDLSVILVTPMDQTSKKTTGISPDAVQIVPSVKKDETKELRKNEISAKITAHKMSLENMSSTSVDKANNSVETNMKIEHSIKKNIIKENDNLKDTNKMTRKSSTICIKYTKVYDKTADTTNNLSIQTPTRKTQKNVNELCHSPFDRSINGLDYVKNKNVHIKKLPVSTAEPFASVYKQNNGAMTFLNQPLDDEYLVSPDFFKVFSSCFPSLSKKHQSVLPNQDLSKGKILAKQ